jgi:excinuclease ABC subunit A
MGPEGGSRGGMVVAEGTPEAVAGNAASYTGQFLKPILQGREATQPKPARKSAAKKTAAKTSPAGKPAKKRSARQSA